MDMPDDIHNYLEEAIQLLWSRSWIFRESNTRFVEKGILDNIKLEWIVALKNLSNADFNQFPFGLDDERLLPNDLHQFLNSVKHLKLRNNGQTAEDVIGLTGTIKGMSPKKSHEVIRLAEVIKEQCQNVDVLVDLGCGLGYLSEIIYKNGGFKILALDCDESRVKSAQDRQKKYFPSSQSHVTFVHHFITESSMDFIEEQILSEFNLKSNKVALIGLHACGDLTVTALKLATNDPLVRQLVIMPCCYHRMDPMNETEFRNFPLSNALRTIIRDMTALDRSPVHVGPNTNPPLFHRPFLRLACQQSVKHWKRMDEQEHRIHGNRMYTRSLVGALAADNELATELTVCRTTKGNYSPINVLSFDQIKKDFRLFNGDLRVPWTDDHQERYRMYWNKYDDGGFLAEILTGFQQAVQEMSENVVLLDKVQYVNELKMEGTKCYIRKIANDQLSPRCYALMLDKS